MNLSADDVSFNGSVYSFFQKGQNTSFGYSFKMSIPTGIDATTIEVVNQHQSDTTYTFQLITETEIIYSDFNFQEIGEVEATSISIIYYNHNF